MMKKLLSLLLVAAMSFSLIACGGSEAPAGNEGGNNAEATNAEKELVVGIAKACTNFDPYRSYGDDTYGHKQIYDFLVLKDAAGAIVPCVADWKTSEDGKEYTFTIRDDVKFSDGTPFTVEDAVYSLQQAEASSYTNWCMVGIESIEKIDDSSFVVKMASPDVTFLEKMTWVPLVNKAKYESLGDKYGLSADAILGSGPYVVKEWVPGESVTLVANESYWRGAPSIKKVTFQSMSEDSAAVISLQTGEVGLFMKDVPSISLATLEQDEKITVTTYGSYVFMDVIMNCGKGIFSDPAARKAVALGVDRDKMLLIGTENQGFKVDYPAGPDYYANPGLENVFPAFDQATAKQMVIDAGLAGTELKIRTMDTDPWPKLATALQDDLNAIGFNASVEQMDYSAYNEQVWGNHDFDIAIGRYWSGTKDIGDIFYNVLATADGAIGNFGDYKNDKMTELTIQGLAESDLEARKEIYAEAVELFIEDIPLIPLYYTNGSRAYSSELTIDENLVQYDMIYDYSWK